MRRAQNSSSVISSDGAGPIRLKSLAKLLFVVVWSLRALLQSSQQRVRSGGSDASQIEHAVQPLAAGEGYVALHRWASCLIKAVAALTPATNYQRLLILPIPDMMVRQRH